jgi:hypothetical protein
MHASNRTQRRCCTAACLFLFLFAKKPVAPGARFFAWLATQPAVTDLALRIHFTFRHLLPNHLLVHPSIHRFADTHWSGISRISPWYSSRQRSYQQRQSPLQWSCSPPSSRCSSNGSRLSFPRRLVDQTRLNGLDLHWTPPAPP